MDLFIWKNSNFMEILNGNNLMDFILNGV
jgi:hypothetical protein